jgi:hypothetical protein
MSSDKVDDVRLMFHNKNNNYESVILQNRNGIYVDLNLQKTDNYFRNIMNDKVNDNVDEGKTDFEVLRQILINFVENQNRYIAEINKFEPKTGSIADNKNLEHLHNLQKQLHDDIGIEYNLVDTALDDPTLCQEFILYISSKYYIISECLLRLLLDTQYNITDGSNSPTVYKYYNNNTPYPNGITNYLPLSSSTSRERNPGISTSVLGLNFVQIKILLENCVSQEINNFIKKFYGIEDVFANSIESIAKLESLESRKNILIQDKNTFDDKVSFSNKKINYYNIYYWIVLLLLILIVIGNIISAVQGSNRFMMINLVVLILLVVRKLGQFIMKLFR